MTGEAEAMISFRPLSGGTVSKEYGEVLPFVATLMGMKLSGRQLPKG